VHFRASGNAPEFRCYVEAPTDARARALLAWGLAKAADEMGPAQRNGLAFRRRFQRRIRQHQRGQPILAGRRRLLSLGHRGDEAAISLA
jgi:hypothetical protein